MTKSILHDLKWTEGAGKNIISREQRISGYHLSLVYDCREVRLYGTHLTSPNSSPYVLMCDGDIRIPQKIARKAWEWVLSELPEHQSCSMLAAASGPEIAPLKWHGFVMDTTVTYLVPLDVGRDIMAGFGSKRRNIIRREASRLQVHSNAPLSEFLVHLQQTWRDKDIRGVDFDVLAVRMQRMVDAGQGGVTAARTKDGTFSAGVFCLWDAAMCHYMFGTTNTDLPTPEGNSLCLSDVMMQRQGQSDVFNFEGSVLRGVEGFVRSFNPDPLLLIGARQTLWTRNAHRLPFLRRFII